MHEVRRGVRTYHFLHLGLDVAQRPFQVRDFGCAFFVVGTRGEFNGPDLAHAGGGIDEKHGHGVLDTRQLCAVKRGQHPPPLVLLAWWWWRKVEEETPLTVTRPDIAARDHDGFAQQCHARDM